MKSILSCAAALLLVSPALAISVGLTSDFQDGTDQGWTAGNPHPDPPVAVADSGPAGAGDYALSVTSNGGFGPGSRLAFYNRGDWSGDYTAAGITAIQADFNYVSTAALQIRLGVTGPGGRFVTDDILLPGSSWSTLTFDVAPANFIAAGGTDIDATLANVTELRFLHNPNAAWQGAALDADLLADNIIALPEPASFALLAVAGLLLRRR